MVVAIVTDAPLVKLFNGEKEKTSQSSSTSPEAEGRLKDTDEGLVCHTSHSDVILLPFTSVWPNFFPFQEPFECESFTHTQNKKPRSQGLCVLLHLGSENSI